MSGWPNSFPIPITMNFWTLRRRILVWTSWFWEDQSLGTDPIKDSLIPGDRGDDAVCHIAGMFQIPLPVRILKDIKITFKYLNLGLGETLSLPIWKEINCGRCLLLKSSLRIGMSEWQERVGPSCRFPVKAKKEPFGFAALKNAERVRECYTDWMSRLKGSKAVPGR